MMSSRGPKNLLRKPLYFQLYTLMIDFLMQTDSSYMLVMEFGDLCSNIKICKSIHETSMHMSLRLLDMN